MFLYFLISVPGLLAFTSASLTLIEKSGFYSLYRRDMSGPRETSITVHSFILKVNVERKWSLWSIELV